MGVESTPHIDIANYALFSLENLFFYYLTFIITWLDSFVEFFLKCFWGTSRKGPLKICKIFNFQKRPLMTPITRFSLNCYMRPPCQTNNDQILILIPQFNLLISRLPNIVQKSFCTPDEAMDPTFPMNYVLAFQHVCSQRN